VFGSQLVRLGLLVSGFDRYGYVSIRLLVWFGYEVVNVIVLGLVVLAVKICVCGSLVAFIIIVMLLVCFLSVGWWSTGFDKLTLCICKQIVCYSLLKCFVCWVYVGFV